jgi:NADH dehydrogenase
MKSQDILVLGGTGFVGRHLVAALAARGATVTVPTRRRERGKALILLPTVEVLEADVHEPAELARLAHGRDAVVNLVGILHSRRGRADERGPNDYGPDFARVHVELPQSVVAACRTGGVKRLLHMSALGAALDAPSEYLRSKAIGERAALAAEDLAVTVFRPSVVFGPDDRFINLFVALARWTPMLALPCPQARFQPVYVGDVAAAMLAALDHPESAGKRYDLCGPRVYTLEELVRAALEAAHLRRSLLPLPDWFSYLQATALEWLPKPLLTRDNYRSMQVPSVCGCGFPFDIRPQALEVAARAWLAPTGPRERFSQLRWRARR